MRVSLLIVRPCGCSKALDKHMAVSILRLKTGINFSDLKVNHERMNVVTPSVKYEFKTTEKFSRE